MGMGEPFLNYDNVMNSIRILNDYRYFNIGVRSISVSTAGIIEGIKKLSEESLHINLAISLHAPNDKLRRELDNERGENIDLSYDKDRLEDEIEELKEELKEARNGRDNEDL
jgi:23S rRNA (adenine2503-C2)-methyltransferase